MALALRRSRDVRAAIDKAAQPGTRLVVVPQPEVGRRALAAALGEDGALLDVQLSTVGGLVERVLREAGADVASPTPRVGMRMAISAALTTESISAAFGASTETPGLVSALERAIAELRGAGVSATRILGDAETPRQRALGEVFARVEHLPIFSDRTWEAARLAPTLAHFPRVELTGFDDIDPATWALLRGLGEVTDVTVRIAYAPERHAAYEARHDRFARWESDAGPATPDPSGAGGSLSEIATRVFAPCEPHPSPTPLRLIGTSGTRAMLRAALEEVRRLAVNGARLSGCALVVPRLAELRDDLDRLAADWRIPIRRRTHVRVLEAPLALALTRLLAVGELDKDDPGALDPLLDWLRSPYSGVDQDEVDRFEVAMRGAGIGERRELMRRWDAEAIQPAIRLTAAAKHGPSAQLQALVDFGAEALRRQPAEGIPSRADLRNRAALDVLAGLQAAFAPEELPGHDELGTRPRGPLPPGALGKIIADLTFTEEVGPSDGLACHDYASLRGHQFRHVVLTGLDGAGYPTGPAPDSLLEGLRERLSDVLPPRAPGTSEHRLRFTHAVGAATDSLTMIRRVADDDGRKLAPSPYWIEVCRVAGREPGELDRAPSPLGELPARLEDAATERDALRLMAYRRQTVPGVLADAAHRRIRPRGLTHKDLDFITEISVTRLANYMNCSYGWLYSDVIQPKEMERPLDAAAEGTFGHEVLERLYGKIAESNPGPCNLTRLSLYLDELPGIVREVASEGSASGPIWDALVARLEVHVAALLSAEAAMGPNMTPTQFERRMSDKRILGPLGPPLCLTGTVDRIDLTADGHAGVVVDYKRGGKRARIEKDPPREILQLVLYPALAESDPDGPDEVRGALYVGILHGSHAGAVTVDADWATSPPKAVSVESAAWDAFRRAGLDRVREAAADLRAGALTSPPADGCPPWCGHPHLFR